MEDIIIQQKRCWNFDRKLSTHLSNMLTLRTRRTLFFESPLMSSNNAGGWIRLHERSRFCNVELLWRAMPKAAHPSNPNPFQASISLSNVMFFWNRANKYLLVRACHSEFLTTSLKSLRTVSHSSFDFFPYYLLCRIFEDSLSTFFWINIGNES